ncbi:SsrA-binding protein SmpB [Heliophilum fasciatum]|uniref:SsrA-binding protein n=1 Tax=Heliophilum fasciatum TaxID=35700 RepID=A0A4R2RFS4_9FIRM|nr:SsrA-binding protein SmpB [Heliophilum fasciatum]MCW2279061.1 SsrA-binding protein [Heliophilum fasciatum]TCP61524.1 SsrA-binding protein [Heliophilum fasciatum]
MSEGVKTVCENRRARHDYHIEDTYEAGIVLKGTEIKSLRNGKGNLKDSFARVVQGEAFLYNMHISPFEQGNRYNHEPLRTRKLLLNKSEIRKLLAAVQQQGLTLVPLRIYLKRGMAKLELAIARGKKQFDKRQDIAKKDAEREMARAVRERQKM